MISKYDQRGKDYWKIRYGECIGKMMDDVGLENRVKNLNTMPVHLGAFVLNNRKRIMNNFK